MQLKLLRQLWRQGRGRAWLLAALAVGALLCSGWVLRSEAGGPAVLFASRESRTAEGAPVFNRIRFERNGDEDIWMMQQSRHGAGAPGALWDRLAIVVSRSRRTAHFYQLEPGALSWSGERREVPFRVACFLCHANGPRAIRPDFAAGAPGWRERLRVFLWNLRIKTYGRLAGGAGSPRQSKPFRVAGNFADEPLPARTCALCHNERWWGRGRLRRQHFLPIRFLLREEEMPPPGISLGEEEEKEIRAFLRGQGEPEKSAPGAG